MAKMKNGHKVWNKTEILQLIDMYRQNEVLWNSKLPEYKNRTLKQEGLQELAGFFQTPVTEIQRKIHNLRCQLNSEVKKLKKRNDRTGFAFKSSWEYFDHLLFLLSADPSEGEVEGIDMSEHLETMIEAESSSYFDQEEYEMPDSENNCVVIKKEPGLTEDNSQDDKRNESITGCSRLKDCSLDLPTINKKTLISNNNKELNNFNRLKKIKFNEFKDDNQIFGDFVAAELRNLKSEINRKKLKRIILKGVLQISELDD